MKKSRPLRAKPKAKRKTRSPDLTGGRKRDTRFQPGNAAGELTQFKAGVSGNPAGRPLGARSRLNEAFLEALGETWAKHGPAALEWLAVNDKALFVQVVASLIPRNAKLELETVQKPVYHIADRSLTAEEWAEKWAEPDGKPN